MDRNYKLRKQNRIVQMIQNIILTVFPVILLLMLLAGAGFVKGIWSGIGSVQGPVDDVQGYAILLEGIFGVFGGFVLLAMYALLIILAVLVAFFWILFGLANSRTCSEKRYAICTIMDAAVKILLIGGYVIANFTTRNLILLIFPAGSVLVLYNLYVLSGRRNRGMN